MPIGYEWGYRRELHVVETSPEQREETGVDISDFVAAVNATRAELPAANVEGAQWRLSAPDAPYLALLRFDAGHPAAARSAVLTLANLTQAPVEIAPAPLLSRTGGYLGPFLERTPGGPAARLRLDKPLALAPNTVRVFAAERAAAMKPKTRPKEPSGDNRVVIETVWPQIDGGRSPVKRIVGETVEVWADIFTDGHEKIAAEVLYRPGDRARMAPGPDGVLRQRSLARQLPARAQRALPVHDRGVARRLGDLARRACEEARRRPRRAPRDHRGRSHRREGRRGRRRRGRGGAARAHGAPHRREAKVRRRSSSFCSRPTTRRSSAATPSGATSRATTACSRSSPTGSRRASRPGTRCSRARNPAIRTATAPSTT